MKITDVKAHHIRIPYDAGVASFRQGASAISALDMVIVEVSTDAGITGWGDAFSYVCPRTTCIAVEEMIAPQARGLDVPDGDGIPAFMEQIQRNLHLFGRYGITMFAISGLDIALWDIAGKAQGLPLHRLIGSARREKIPAYASLLRIGKADAITGECEAARRLGYGAIKLQRDHAARGVRRARGARRRRSADDRHELSAGWTERDRLRAGLSRSETDVPRRTGLAAGGFCHAGRGAQQRRARHRRGRERLHRVSVSPDDDRRRRKPRAAFGHQSRRHHRIPESRRDRRRARRQGRAAFALFRSRLSGDAAAHVAAGRRLPSRCST